MATPGLSRCLAGVVFDLFISFATSLLRYFAIRSKAMPHPIPRVLRADCLHCGGCQEICPQVFQVDHSLGFAVVINPRGASPLLIQAAMDTCPVQCILWHANEISDESLPPSD